MGLTAPRRVVTRITPFAAREPYSAAVAPSFNTERFSTSSGFSPSNANLSLTTPSMTYSGSALLNVPTARTRIFDSRPGVPAFWVTLTPESRPWSALERLSTGTLETSAPATLDTAPVTVPRSCTRYAVTTCASSWAGSAASCTSTSLRPSIGTSWG